MSKTKKIVALSLIGLVVLLFITIMIYYFGATYKQFYAIATKEFSIPGLDTSFVPQGMTYVESTQDFLISGYMSDNSPSRIYVVDKTTGETEKYITLKQNNTPYTKHAGGIAVNENDVFVVGDSILVRFSLSNLIQCQNAESVEIIDSLTTGNNCDFVLTYNDNLIVGEFYKSGKYETKTIHHIKTSDDQTNYALSYIYKLDSNGIYGLKSTAPIGAISMPNQVQGMTFTKNGDIFLSTSYSIADSILFTYNNILEQPTTNQITLQDKTIPLYILDGSQLKSTLKAPAMSEEVILHNDKVFILFESKCKKYKFVNRTRLGNVYSLDI